MKNPAIKEIQTMIKKVIKACEGGNKEQALELFNEWKFENMDLAELIDCDLMGVRILDA